VLTSEDGDEAEASLQDMLYSRLKEGFAGVDRDAVAKHAARALRLRSHERLLLNFSKYKPGDFLSSHTDSPSGSPAYERKRAWVWHLSDEGWDGEALGGNFLDEVTGVQYAPVYNAIVHFEVPRRHSVEKVLSGAPNRYVERKALLLLLLLLLLVLVLRPLPLVLVLTLSTPGYYYYSYYSYYSYYYY